MEGKHRALLLLTCLALIVTSLNGMVDLAVKLNQTFRASAVSDYGERLSVKVRCSSGRPSYAWWLMWCSLKATCSWNPTLWRLAWRVGGSVVTNVENAVTITVSGSNIESPVTVDYYIEARKPDGTVLGKTLDVTGASCNVGDSISDSTGSVDIDQHLSSLGLSTTQDQTVDYYVWVKVMATGLISGETLTAEVGPVEFDSVTYDYGTQTTHVYYANADTWVYEYAPTNNYGTSSTMNAGLSGNGKKEWILVNFTLPSGLTADGVCSCTMYLRKESSGSGTFTVYRVTGDWSETAVNWYSKPGYTTVNGSSADLPSSYPTWVSWDVTQLLKDALKSGSVYGFYVQSSASGTQFDTRESSYDPYISLTYFDWTASWSWYPLPLSIVSMPIGRQLFLGLVIGLTCFAAIVKLAPRGGMRK